MPLDICNGTFTRIINIWAVHQEGHTEKRFFLMGSRRKSLRSAVLDHTSQ